MSHPAKTRLNAAAFYQLPEHEANDLIQLIDGEVVIAISRHQAIVGEILFLLMTIAKKSRERAFTSPIEV
jgi:hypothetical protein